MHLVEIRRRGVELGNVMAQMRTWVDHHRVELKIFEVSFLGSGEVRFRLDFEKPGEALAFAHAFDGELSALIDESAAA